MSEFSGPIINNQDPECPWNKGIEFQPFAAALNSAMAMHGADKKAHEMAERQDTKPRKVSTEGFTIFLLETECPLWVSDWAMRSRAGSKKPQGPEHKL